MRINAYRKKREKRVFQYTPIKKFNLTLEVAWILYRIWGLCVILLKSYYYKQLWESWRC